LHENMSVFKFHARKQLTLALL